MLHFFSLVLAFPLSSQCQANHVLLLPFEVSEMPAHMVQSIKSSFHTYFTQSVWYSHAIKHA